MIKVNFLDLLWRGCEPFKLLAKCSSQEEVCRILLLDRLSQALVNSQWILDCSYFEPELVGAHPFVDRLSTCISVPNGVMIHRVHTLGHAKMLASS